MTLAIFKSLGFIGKGFLSENDLVIIEQLYDNKNKGKIVKRIRTSGLGCSKGG